MANGASQQLHLLARPAVAGRLAQDRETAEGRYQGNPGKADRTDKAEKPF